MARSVQMRLYTMQKRHFLLAFTTFAALFLISVLLGAASPNMVERMTEHAFDKNRTGKLPRGPWVLPSPKLSRFYHSTLDHLYTCAQVQSADVAHGGVCGAGEPGRGESGVHPDGHCGRAG